MSLKLYFEYENKSKLKQELQTISQKHQLALAATICERLLPNYNAFVRNFHGNPQILRDTLNKVWEIVTNSSVDKSEINQLIKKCRDLPPQEDNDCEQYAYEASMTRTAICCALKFSLSFSLVKMFEVLEIAADIIAETIIIEKDKTNPEWYESKTFSERYLEIANHPFSVRERNKQNEVFQQLKSTSFLDANFVKQLKSLSNNNQKSSTDLC